MKKNFTLSLLSFFFIATTTAQQPDIRYHELPVNGFLNPVVLGKTGNQYVIMDRPGPANTQLYFLDTAYQLQTQKTVPSYLYDVPVFGGKDQIQFLWQKQERDSLGVFSTVIKESGEIKDLSKMIPAPKPAPGYEQVVADKQNRFFLFYSFFKTKESLVLKAALFNRELVLLKQIDRAFACDFELDRPQSPVLDIKGNIHLLIYDRLTNYRLSATAQLYTIPIEGDDAIAESFQFDKAKFYDLLFFDDAANSQVKIAGFYYDGTNRVKQGIATVAFPYERGNEMIQRFFPFSKEQRESIAQKMEHVRRKNDVMDFVKLKEIYEEDGTVTVTAWVMDVPNQQLYKDNEKEEMQNRDLAGWVKSRDATAPYRVASKKIIASAPYIASVQGVMASPDVVSPQPNGNMFLQTRQVINPFSPSLPVAMPSYNNTATYTPFKIGLFTIPAKADSLQFHLLPGDFHIRSVYTSVSLWNQPLQVNGKLNFLHYHIPSENSMPVNQKTGKEEQMQPMLITVNDRSETVSPLVQLNTKDNMTFYSRPWKINEKDYLVAYKFPGSKSNGVALIRFE